MFLGNKKIDHFLIGRIVGDFKCKAILFKKGVTRCTSLRLVISRNRILFWLAQYSFDLRKALSI